MIKPTYEDLEKRIKELEKTEKTLLENNERLERIFDYAPDALYLNDLKGTFIDGNKTAEEITGYKKGELIGKNFLKLKLLSKKDLSTGAKLLAINISGKSTGPDEFTLNRKDGTQLQVEIRTYPLKIKDQRFVLGVARDITERKKAENTLKESEEKYRILVENMRDSVSIIDLSGRLLFANKAGEELTGHTFEEKKGENIRNITPKKYGPLYLKKILEAKKGKPVQPFETEIINNKGKRIPVETCGQLIEYEGKKAIQIVTRDITQRKEEEKVLKQQYYLFQLLADNIHFPVYLKDADGKFMYANKETIRQLVKERDGKIDEKSISIDTVLGKTDLDFMSDNKVKEYREEELRIIKLKEPLINEVTTSEDGIYYSLRTKIPLHDPSGKPVLLGINYDITELKKAEEELKTLSSVVEQSTSLIVIMDKEGVVRYVNQMFIDNAKYNPEDIIGKYWGSVISKNSNLREHLHDIKKTVLEQGSIWRAEIEDKEKDGNVVWRDSRIFPIKDKNGKITHSIYMSEDITARKKAEEEKENLQEQLFQSQKMESIGRLAGGIAHDFNNILTGIMGYAELLKMTFRDLSTLEGEAADVILKNAERATDLTKQLLGFARKGKYNPLPLNINDLIRDTVIISEKIFEKNIKVNFDLTKNVNIIEADKIQIDQVLTNIFINAKDAMPMGGDITVKTENVYIDEEFAKKYPELESGKFVKISIADTGIGIPDEVRKHIFEPFFTTKGLGKGTGLGLATVYGIIKNHNGHVFCESEPGRGSTFTIYLPVSEKEIQEVFHYKDIIKGKEKILLVDDEESIRNIGQKQLENLGYKIILAADGKEAVKIYKEKKGKIDLILLDIIMPESGGKETYRELKKINPDIKVIVMSGYSQDEKANEIMNDGALGFIQKPFKIHELSKIIYEILKKSK